MSVAYTHFNGWLLHENRGGVESFFVPDQIGSTVVLTDSTGSTTDSFSFWPYGEVMSRTGFTATPFSFLGAVGYYSEQTGRIYVRARYYLKTLARWLTADPTWPHQPPYEYARSTPVMSVDSSGLWPGIKPIDCDQGEKNKLENLLKNICDPQKNSELLKCLRQYRCQIDDEEGTMASLLQSICKGDGWRNAELKIRCDVGLGCRGKDGGVAIEYHPHGVYLCPSGLSDGGCTLIHELIHIGGQVGHPKDSAFACIPSFPGCKGKPVKGG